MQTQSETGGEGEGKGTEGFTASRVTDERKASGWRNRTGQWPVGWRRGWKGGTFGAKFLAHGVWGEGPRLKVQRLSSQQEPPLSHPWRQPLGWMASCWVLARGSGRRVRRTCKNHTIKTPRRAIHTGARSPRGSFGPARQGQSAVVLGTHVTTQRRRSATPWGSDRTPCKHYGSLEATPKMVGDFEREIFPYGRAVANLRFGGGGLSLPS